MSAYPPVCERCGADARTCPHRPAQVRDPEKITTEEQADRQESIERSLYGEENL